MGVIDVDAHLHEPLDWVEQTDPTLAKALGSPARFMEVADAMFGISNPALAVLPESRCGPEARPAAPAGRWRIPARLRRKCCAPPVTIRTWRVRSTPWRCVSGNCKT